MNDLHSDRATMLPVTRSDISCHFMTFDLRASTQAGLSFHADATEFVPQTSSSDIQAAGNWTKMK